MKTPATDAERQAIVRLVSASATLIIVIGRGIMDHGLEDSHPMAISDASAEFVDAVMGANEPAEEP